MSATRDKNQKVTFIYQNFHQLYKKGVDAAKAANVPSVNATSSGTAEAQVQSAASVPTGLKTSQVLKVEDLNSPTFGVVRPGLRIDGYTPPEFIAKRVVAKPAAIAASVTARHNPAVQSLKDNLKNLNDLHSRLRFMLQELEDLIKEDK